MPIKNNQMQHYSLATRLLITCGAIGPLLFILVFLIEGATRPGYSAWRNFVSTLSLGDQGWEQSTNFIICGLLLFSFAVGLRRVLRSGKSARWGPILVGGFGLGQVVAGLFVTGPSISFFPGIPGINPSTIHGLSGILVLGCVAAACLVLARRFADDPNWRGWRPYSIITGVVVAVFFVASIASSLVGHGWRSWLFGSYARCAHRSPRRVPQGTSREGSLYVGHRQGATSFASQV